MFHSPQEAQGDALGGTFMRDLLGRAAGLVGLACVLGLAGGAAAEESSTSTVNEVIVTGTRTAGLRAADSPAPIQVLGAPALARTGSPGLIDALALAVPSFNAQAIGGDMANETLSARLRGLSPNHVLVLINGKRRHGTANLAILSSVFQGGAAADLDMIPAAAIDHIEVLQDGAAAQYGSDAIAGVINIILKSAPQGGSAQVSGGGYYDGGGLTADYTGNVGLGANSPGYLNLTNEVRFHDFSNRGGPDQRVVQAVESGAEPSWANLQDYPYVNKIFGDARYDLSLISANAGYDLGGAQLYAFGTWGLKNAGGWANFRVPTKLPQLYPVGFNPVDELHEQDFAATGGVRGETQGWRWDLSSTYGGDFDRVNVTHSANVDLFDDTGSTPTDFRAGNFNATQWTNNLDISRPLDLGMAGPATLAFGAEHRRETYEIKAGDPASRYKAGSQSYPGFSLTDAGSHSRHNFAAYAELDANPVKKLTVDLAGRWEHFSDFGDTTVGKITGRYDFTEAFALRGTASTGFRAPTLAEEFYSATNVQPNSAYVQLPPNAPAARLIGIDPLKPEKSTNFSAGFVARPGGGILVTLDAYQISIKDRVVGSGTLYGTYGGVLRSPAVNAAIIANGNVLENVPFTGINVFSNGIDTRTRGVDLVITAASVLGDAGRIDWTLAANYNTTVVTGVRATPPQLAASGQSLFDKVAISTLETASPKVKVILEGLWSHGRWSVDVKESLYGQASRYQDPGDGNLYLDKQGVKFLTDLEVSYRLGGGWTVSAGADNLFNVYPDRVSAAAIAASAAAGNPAIEIYPAFSAIGIDGGYYFAKVRYQF